MTLNLSIIILISQLFSFSGIQPADYFVASQDLNLRDGIGTKFKSITVIKQGDTVKLLDSSKNWVKVEYGDKIGYSSKQYLVKIDSPQEEIIVEKEKTKSEDDGFYSFLFIYLFIVIALSIFFKKSGDKHRYKTTAAVLSLIFGFIGLQKFYLGQTTKGVLSILFGWTLIPSLIGLIDFLTIILMKGGDFQNKFNKETQSTKIVNLNSGDENNIAIVFSSKNSETKKYVIDLYKRGFYIEDILEKVKTKGMKMPNGKDITIPYQIALLIKTAIPSAKIKSRPKSENSTIKPNFKKNDFVKDDKDKSENLNTIVDSEIQSLVEKVYPNNTEMQKILGEEQKASKRFMMSAKDIEAVNYAKERYPYDYSMQEYVYKDQVESKYFMSKVKDKEIKSIALDKYPNDYSMQEYIYKEQLKSKSFMRQATNSEIKKIAETKYPEDYSMQEYVYNEQLALPENERIKATSDDSIIDVNSFTLDISIERTQSQIQPPYWKHTYVFSQKELENATASQKKFYNFMKEEFKNGAYVDIQGNTNYAFVLFFDLIEEYKNHNDIKLVERQFELLGEICPKTKRYSLRWLKEEFQKLGDQESIDRLNITNEPSFSFDYNYSDYNPDLYKLGNQYKNKLSLETQEIKWLNKFYNPSNVFLSIEECCIVTIKQYLYLLKELDVLLIKNQSSLENEVSEFKEKMKDSIISNNSMWDYFNNNYEATYLSNQAESDIFLTIFKRTENSVRDFLGHKRKLSDNLSSADVNISDEFEEKLGNPIQKILDNAKDNIPILSIPTQIELNAQNVNRWQNEFNKLKEGFNKGKMNSFIDGIKHLEETNQKNTNIEKIFFEASKFISKYDKVQSLKYYSQYIYYDLKSQKFDNRELTKTVQKSLFKNEEQIHAFKDIISELIQTSDIKSALDKISKFYVPKRKKINLNMSEIKNVERKHEGTVELLNEYLETKNELPESSSNEEIQVQIIQSEDKDSILKNEISIGAVQEEVIKLIINNSYTIEQIEVEKFAIKNGMFKNQLIDSINEACQDFLDGEALIEEEDENYVIEKSYYQEIVK